MMRMMGRIALALSVWLLVAAWDTRVIAVFPWQSIYQDADGLSLAEHTTISDETFDRLDPSGQLRALFGRGGSATLDVVDLNASHFRQTLLGVEPFGDDEITLSEERTIPPPGLFSGLPDYSYGIYDWLNKNTTCPAFADGHYAWRCHEFMGWLGALNSVHFGTQARDMYAHQHRNALALAERARIMREAMTDAEREVYEEDLREAELLALAYEGYAQHFLQDRWAVGQMWDRWAAPDPQQQDESLPAYLAIGALAGIIHGSEALVSQYDFLEVLLMRADPMSSPLPGPGRTAQPMHYRHVRRSGEGPPIPAVGDERLQDALIGQFSLNRYQRGARNQRLNVQTQLDGMFECSSAGWVEVIQALGPTDSGYGVYGASLSGDIPEFEILEQEDCWNMWATNESMMIGMLGPNAGRSVALIAAVDFVIPDIGPDVGVDSDGIVVGYRAEFVAYAARLWLYGRDNPNGTEVARGEMTSYAQSFGNAIGLGASLNPNTLWNFREGGDYALPDYAEPLGLVTEGGNGGQTPLPENDARGRDIQTLYGAFNGAQSDYWCENREIFNNLRAAPSPINREMCEHLANRMYEGSHPSYEGVQAARREFEDAPVRSICRIRNTDGVESDEYDDPDNPFWIDPGYFPALPRRQSVEPTHTNFDAVANWCARVPVLTQIGSPDMQNQNIVAEISEEDEELILYGSDLGESGGTIQLESFDGTEIALTQITEWNDTEIRINVASIGWEDGDDFVVTLTPDPAGDPWDLGAAPGLYVISIREPVEIESVRVDLGGVGPCRAPMQGFEWIDLSVAAESQDAMEDFERLADQYAEDLAPIRAYFAEKLACMRELRPVGLPVHRRAQNSAISFIAVEQAPYSGHVVLAPAFALNSLVSNDPVAPGNLVPWEDYYTTYIDNLEGTIWYLERVDNLVQAWAIALSDDEPRTRMPDPYHEVFSQADTIADVLDAGFQISTEIPPGMPPEMAAQLNDAMRGMDYGFFRMDMGFISENTNTLVSETLRGLPAWMQVQDTLTHHAIPDLEREIDQIGIAAQAQLAEILSNGGDFSCREFGGSSCEYFLDPDTERFNALNNWINAMSQGAAIHMPGVTVNLGYYESTAGTQRAFRDWPPDRAAEAARAGPGATPSSDGPAGLEPIEFDFDPPDNPK